MIYEEIPKEFNPDFTSVGCFVEYNKEILLLHRQNLRPQGNTWGIPSGKIKPGETQLEAMVREIKEETSFEISPSEVSPLLEVYVKYPEFDFIYPIFHTQMECKKQVKLNDEEHKDFMWISPKKALNMPLIMDLDACINLLYK